MIRKAQSKLIYIRVYNRLSELRLIRTTISPDELVNMIRQEYRLCRYRTDKANINYTLGFFKKNRVVVPDGYRLRISIGEEGVSV